MQRRSPPSGPGSLLWLYRRLLQLRRREPALTAGEQIPVRSRNDILAYRRKLASDELFVALNTVHQPRRLNLQAPGKVLMSTHPGRETIEVQDCLTLGPDEGVIIKIAPS